jgi:hypothetical protein
MRDALRGKGWRVVGYFVWMLGAGVVLDSNWLTVGRTLLAIGAAVLLYGVWQSRRAGEGGRP